MIRRIAFLFTVVLSCGCASASIAPESLQAFKTRAREKGEDVLADMRYLEKVSGRGDCDMTILDIEDRGEEMLGYVEFWTVKSCGVRTTYKLRIVPLGENRIKYSVSYPRAAEML